MGAHFALVAASYARTSIPRALLACSTVPVWVFLIATARHAWGAASLARPAPPTARQWGGCAATLAGLSLLALASGSGDGDGLDLPPSIVGDALGLCAALAQAIVLDTAAHRRTLTMPLLAWLAALYCFAALAAGSIAVATVAPRTTLVYTFFGLCCRARGMRLRGWTQRPCFPTHAGR